MTEKQKQEDVKDDQILELGDCDDKFSRIIKLLRPGYSIQIYRTQPTWCKGYCETVDVLDNDTIDLPYLVETWGGKAFSLRVCDEKGIWRGNVSFQCASYSPKVRGKKITREGIDGDDELPDGVRYVNQPQAIQRQPMPQGGSAGMGAGNVMETVVNTIKSLKSMQNDDLALLREALGATQIQPRVVGDTIDGVLDTVRKYKELEAVFGGATRQLEDNTKTDGNAQFFGVIKEVLQALTPRPVAALPVQAAPMAQPQLVQNPSTRNIGVYGPGSHGGPKGGEPTQIGVEDIFPVLQKLDPSQLSEAFYGLLGTMTEDKREEVLKLIFTRLGIEDDILSAEEEDEALESK